ncbi:MAG: hypothetical protein SV583_05260 [Pseudomonadota bacterium]|nr:hypothetical protein [Pseudomonadota bacterium]
MTFSEDQRDCLQEVVNVAMGKAGDSLARFLRTFVNLSVPRIRLVGADCLPQVLREHLGRDQTISAVRQGFHSATRGGVHGEAVTLYSDSSFQAMADLLDFDSSEDANQIELMLDTSNILTGACLNGISEQLGGEVGYSAPSVLGLHCGLTQLMAPEQLGWDQALLIEINYSLECREFYCTLVLLMPADTIVALRSILSGLLEDL